MKPLTGPHFDSWRRTDARTVNYFGGIGDETCGAFRVPCHGAILFIIASSGMGWDHVSVSLPSRCPTWDEMQFVKRTFFADHEWAYELHPPAAQNISLHNYCLHLWRPHDQDIPLPPSIFVGPEAAKESA